MTKIKTPVAKPIWAVDKAIEKRKLKSALCGRMIANDLAENAQPKWMLNRDGTIRGEIRNLNCRRCQMEGCTGMRIHVKWPDGKSTYPCSKGCEVVDAETLKIV